MFESNVLGVVRVTKALLPALRRGTDPSIVIIGSVAGVEVYEGGGGYTAAKHAAHAIAETLRLELHREQIRVTEIAPGMVETEFSLVRFEGDAERAAGVYDGIDPAIVASAGVGTASGQSAARTLKLDTGKQIYDSGCVAVPRRGREGTVAEPRRLRPPSTFPDFSDCPTAAVEPDFQWRAIITNGGAARAFSTSCRRSRTC